VNIPEVPDEDPALLLTVFAMTLLATAPPSLGHADAPPAKGLKGDLLPRPRRRRGASFNDLVGATPQDKLVWRRAKAVRSTAEVFLTWPAPIYMFPACSA
jgi:hypothetical protein